MDEKRPNGIVGIKFVVREDALFREGEVICFWFGNMEEIANDANENESNSHEWTIGIERPCNDGDQG